eukprot:2224040-Alexandrium_andersonii.AAC.1
MAANRHMPIGKAPRGRQNNRSATRAANVSLHGRRSNRGNRGSGREESSPDSRSGLVPMSLLN